LVAGLVLVLAIAAWDRNRVYESEVLLWSDTLAKADHPRAWMNLGGALAEARQFPEARKCLERSLALEPGNVKARTDYGVILHLCGEIELAREQLELAVQLGPENLDATINLGFFWLRMGNFGESIKCYERALAQAPGDGACRTHYAAALVGAGRLQDAVEQCQRVLEAEPERADTRRVLASARSALERQSPVVRLP
jgi:tetratricopeptide (TPR) repeat protein